MESFVEYCKNHVINNIGNYEGQSVYGADFCYTITEGMNADGTCTYSRSEAMEYLKEWWNDAADYYDYHKNNFGDAPTNPFENPEAYMVCMVIQGCNALLSQTQPIEDHWNDEFVLTEKIISEIIEKVESIDKIEL